MTSMIMDSQNWPVDKKSIIKHGILQTINWLQGDYWYVSSQTPPPPPKHVEVGT